MSVDVTYEGGRYWVELSPPHGTQWTSSWLTATEVLEELSARGCHSTAITDALFAANPEWPEAHDAEVRRRRELELQAILDEGSDADRLLEEDD
ncbi:MAG: hypothetical protein F2659_04060 [Actinobacteria bacterium]|uniref:Unannotated protein n=1 Tax=freshwater metagenome TaxID=449393 RepID=A0A6J6NYV9_9ZZZZ|nr:hypothetical protein [Actinomycetota bacterium]